MSTKNVRLKDIEPEVFDEMSILSSHILDMILKIMDGDTGSIMLLNERDKTLKIISQKGIPENIAEHIRVSLNNSIAGYAIRKGNALILNRGDTFLGQPLTRDEIGSSIVFPIVSYREKIGVININRSPERVPFSVEDLELASLLVRYSSILMGGVLQYSRAIKSARIASSSYRVLRNISRHKNPRSVIKALVQTLLEITKGAYGIAVVYEDGNFRTIYGGLNNMDEGEREKIKEIFNNVKENRKEIILQDTATFPIIYEEEILGAVHIKLKERQIDLKEKKMIKFLFKDVGIILKNLINYQEQKEKTRQEERIRITNILHDRVCQGVTDGIIRIQYIKKLDLPEELLNEITGLEDLLKDILNDVRCIIFEEKPIILKGDFFDTLREYVKVIEDKSNIKFTLIFSGDEELIPKRVRESLFPIIREAIVNIRRHSMASSALIKIEVKENHINIDIEDNGVGFDSNSYKNREDSFGIKMMRDRVSSLGGNFEIEGVPFKGTRIDICIPT